MANVRKKSVLLSAIVTAFVLFGGTLLYDHWFVDRPINRALEQESLISEYSYTLSNKSLHINALLTHNASLKHLYTRLNNQLSAVIGSRHLVISPLNKGDDEIQTYWNSVSLEVAQALDNLNYVRLQDLLNKQSDNGVSKIEGVAEADDTSIYIRLSNAKNDWFITIPRNPIMRMWNQE